MDNLKMKFKLHGLEFELEGNEATVKEEFANFKAFITADLLSKINIIAPQVTTVSPASALKQIGQIQDATTVDLADFPILKEVVKKDLPKTESDWILIYGLYSSEFGEKPFSEKDIRSQYESTGRNKSSRLGNITNNIKTLLNKEYFKMHNDNEYILKDKGLEYAKQILQGNSTSKSIVRTTTRVKSEPKSVEKVVAAKGKNIEEPKRQKSNKTNSVGFVDLKLTPAEQKALNDYFIDKKPKTQNEKVLVAMKWFIDDKKVVEVSLEELNYLLSIAAETPSALAQVLVNMGGSQFRWVTKGSAGKYQLSSIGENYVVNKLPKQVK